MLHSILASNEFGLNLAKYLPNGVSIFISVLVEGPDVTLRLFGMLNVAVVDIFVVGQALEVGWYSGGAKLIKTGVGSGSAMGVINRLTVHPSQPVK